MARAIATAASAVDEIAISRGTLCGFSAREAAVAPGAAATVVIRNGTTAAAPVVAVVELAAKGSQTATLPAVDCPDGIFVERSAGETEVILYVA